MPEEKKPQRLYTFSHSIMAGIMLTFFVGVGLSVWAVVTGRGQLSETLAFIMELAKIVTLGYFTKAFGENITRIVLSSVSDRRREAKEREEFQDY